MLSGWATAAVGMVLAVEDVGAAVSSRCNVAMGHPCDAGATSDGAWVEISGVQRLLPVDAGCCRWRQADEFPLVATKLSLVPTNASHAWLSSLPKWPPIAGDVQYS